MQLLNLRSSHCVGSHHKSCKRSYSKTKNCSCKCHDRKIIKREQRTLNSRTRPKCIEDYCQRESHMINGLCKMCYQRWRRKTFPEKIRKWGNNYYARNKKLVAAKRKKYQSENIEKIRKLQKIHTMIISSPIGCRNKHPIITKVTKNWIGVWAINFKPPSKKLNVRFNQKICKQANYLCEICGWLNVESHHIIHRNKYPGLSLNPNNGIALCHDHHKEVHGWGDFINNVRLVAKLNMGREFSRTVNIIKLSGNVF